MSGPEGQADRQHGEAGAEAPLAGAASRQALFDHAREQAGRGAPAALEALEAFDKTLPPDPSRQAALRKLGEGAVAIVAGQQPGLFGGPLLTIFKIASAIRLADFLTHEGQAAVAVFWNASEDHDLDEADRLFLISASGLETRLHHARPEGRGAALSRIRFGDAEFAAMRAWFDDSRSPAPDEAWFPQPSEAFGSWMSRTIAQLFAGKGLILLEPGRLGATRHAAHLAILKRHDVLRYALQAGTEALRRAHHEPRLDLPGAGESLLMIDGPTGRRRARLGEGLPAESEWSSSVAARPLVQQMLLPVAAQICGPGEADYMAQIAPMFAALDLRAPLVWPRLRGAVLAPEEARALDDIAGAPADSAAAADPAHWPPAAGDPPAEWLDAVERLREATRRGLEPRDAEAPEVVSGRQSAARKIGRALAEWESDLAKRWKQRHAAAVRRRRALAEKLRPRGRFQERTLSIASFTAWPPDRVIHHVLRAADPFDTHFRFVVLPDEERQQHARR